MDGNNKHRAGFEQTDVNVAAVGKVAAALLLVTIAAMALLVGVFDYLKASNGGKGVAINPADVFPHPRLEKNPALNLRTIRAAEEQTLTSYGWVDQQKGVVRIPIAQAMDLVVKKGLPFHAAAPPSAAAVSVPTESGLGPKMLPPGGPLGEGK
jgi:hypothetical protein